MSEPSARRFYVEQAFIAAQKINGDGQLDYIHLGLVQGALEYVLERWDEWSEVERQDMMSVVQQGGPDGQADVGAGCSEIGGEVGSGAGGGGGQDVQVGDTGEHASPTSTEAYQGCERRQHPRYPHLDTITGGLLKLGAAAWGFATVRAADLGFLKEMVI